MKVQIMGKCIMQSKYEKGSHRYTMKQTACHGSTVHIQIFFKILCYRYSEIQLRNLITAPFDRSSANNCQLVYGWPKLNTCIYDPNYTTMI